MKNKLSLPRIHPDEVALAILPLFLFWVVLMLKVPYSFTQYFRDYSPALFILVLALYFLCFKSSSRYGVWASLGLTMLLLALTLSFKWTSGYSDNKVLGGFLPYKDGENYYFSANLILNGLPLANTVQSGWRPLFPGFLASLLLLMAGNMKWVLASLVLLAGVGSYSSSRQIFNSFGPPAASVFSTFLYFYIQPSVGLAMTELIGFTVGCFAFSILWRVSRNRTLFDLVLGLLTLVVSLSARAGTFFILPLLALWAGRIFRGTKKFSFRVFAIALVTILLGYFLANSVYARLVGVPKGTVFGNFAYSLYGQVHGGTGWHRGIEELGTTKPAPIYRAAFQFFLKHPFSLFIGMAKAYRDFFLPGPNSMFAFGATGQLSWADYILWGIVVGLFVWSLIRLVKNMAPETSSLLLAGFMGFLLSVPFLPPIDGGSRFYASTVPFFFAIPVVILRQPQGITAEDTPTNSYFSESTLLGVVSAVLMILTVVAPPLILKTSSKPSFDVPSCPSGQQPFALRIEPESYLDLFPNNDKCGLVPEICLKDFEQNSVEKTVDDFYQKLDSLVKTDNTNVRIIPALDLVGGRDHYFYVLQSRLPNISQSNLITGCAVEIETKNQSIYRIESIAANENQLPYIK